jgi:hypothetical protein
MPFFCLSEPGPTWGHVKDPTRIDYLADKQNRALEKAMLEFPKTTHILWVDSYYLDQTRAIQRLVADHETLSATRGDLILGGAILCHDRTRIKHRIRYYDTWSTPELDGKQFRDDLSNTYDGFQTVSSVGGAYVYPRGIWEKNRYQRPEPFPESGCQHNYLCRKSRLPVFLDWNALFWREISYSISKRVRSSIGIYRRRGLQVSASPKLASSFKTTPHSYCYTLAQLN